jgi:tRNA-(ms[2]io[6]A)-hydroxylase
LAHLTARSAYLAGVGDVLSSKVHTQCCFPHLLKIKVLHHFGRLVENREFCTSKRFEMLGLKLPTDPRWVNIVEKNIEDILTDHAWCEQKAASTAISLITRFPEYPDMVKEFTALAREEMEHFAMVHEKLQERGFSLGFEEKDPYVKDLRSFIRKGGNRATQLVEALLMAAMIEARSCERFRLLSEEINDEDLRKFYRGLMASEARHYTLFLKFAKKYGEGVDVDRRWKEFLDYESSLMTKYGKRETMHG